MKVDKGLGMVGLATKAGKVASGEFMTENAVKSGMAYLVIVSSEAFRNMCEFYHVPIKECWTKDELGKSTGKTFRASLAVTDEGLAQAILKKMD